MPVIVSKKGLPITGDVQVCNLWTPGIDDRMSVHRTDCRVLIMKGTGSVHWSLASI